MKNKALLLLVPVLILACITPPWVPSQVQAPTETAILASPTALPVSKTVVPTVSTATVRATVYVRKSASAYAEEAGSLETGDSIEIVDCSRYWCRISKPVAGYVWRGCTSDNPEKLFCQARP